MKIQLNGQFFEISSAEIRTVADLLRWKGLDRRPVVVEKNGEALFARDHVSTPLADGDVIEVVEIAAGG